MKILTTTPIPTEELFKLRKECEALHDHIEKLLEKSYVETPKEEASSESKAEAAAEDPKEEAATDGIVVHNKSNTKPFEMVIE